MTSRTQAKRKRRSLHKNCRCNECAAAHLESLPKAIRYIHDNPALRLLMSKMNPLEEGRQLDSIINAAGSRFGHPYQHAWDEAALGHEVYYVPGYVVLFHVGEDGQIGDDNTILPLELHDVEPGDAGVGLLRSLLQADCGEGLAPNFALWFTGIFGAAAPLHLVGVNSEGLSAGAITAEAQGVALQACNLEPCLELLRNKFPRESLPKFEPKIQEALGSRAIDGPAYRLFEALHHTYGVADYAKRYAGEKFLEMKKLVKRHGEAMEKLRTDLIAEATSRRKAAVAAKNAQLDASRSRNTEAEKEIAQLKALVRRLQSEHSGPGNALVPSVAVAPAVDEPEPFVERRRSVVDDESYLALNETIEHQSAVIRELRLALRHTIGQSPDDPEQQAPAPRTLADLDLWAAENGDRLIILKRALSAAKKSVYEDVPLVYQALDILATIYRDVKLGIADRMAFKDACLNAGLDFGGSITEGVTEDYYFTWQMRRRHLDQHVGRGTTRDPRYCLRIYFTWDDEFSKVIVGWLPSHLPTRDS